jgi:predicted nucleic acid-binding protein
VVTRWVVDTNVWPETANPHGNPVVQAWMAQRHDRVYMTLVTVAEVRYGGA